MTVDLRRLLDASAPTLVDWAGLRRFRSLDRRFSARDGQFDEASSWEDEGFMVEVLHYGSFGYACTASSNPSSLQAAFARAKALAETSGKRGIHAFAPDARPVSRIEWESPRKMRSTLSAADFSELVVSLSSSMRVSDKIILASALLSTREIEIEIVSTTGAALHQSLYLASHNLQAIARDGPIVQKRTVNGPHARIRQGGAELFERGELELSARKAAEEAVELLGAQDCPSMNGDLVLAPDQMILQIHESVGHPCELDRILGDERNFAGSTFVKAADIGSFRYGSELMNVTFDPTVPGEASSFAFDDTGLPAEREFIIKDGILIRAIGGIESQLRSGLPGVAAQRADSWSRAPIDRMANLNLEPGQDSFEDIVAGIERGVYMEANRSWSIDDYRNKFQFGCEYGKLIENGRITRTLRNPNYRGVSASFWRSLFKVGNRDTLGIYGASNCGKGEPNQLVFVGHSSPVCAFKQVEIFGGKA